MFVASLLEEVTALKEELNVLRNTVFELNQHRDGLQEQLERKNDLLCSTNKQLDDKVTMHRYILLSLRGKMSPNYFACSEGNKNKTWWQ